MIDNLDKRIIEIMKKDSRCPFVEIANQLGVSEGTVRSRVHRMTEEGIIRGFTIKTSSRNVKALVEIRIDVNTDTQEIAKELAGYDGVTEVFEVTGDQDIIAIVDVESSQHLNDIISIYKHNQKLLRKTGDKVKAGSPIALVGSTGSLSSGDHLHFELWYKGEAVDPTKYINF